MIDRAVYGIPVTCRPTHKQLLLRYDRPAAAMGLGGFYISQTAHRVPQYPPCSCGLEPGQHMHGNLVHADRGGHWTSTRYFTPHILFKVFLAKHCTSSIALIPLFRPVLPARIGYSWGYNVTSAVFKLLYKPRVAENWSQVLVPLRWWPGLRIQMFPEDISPVSPRLCYPCIDLASAS